MTIIITTHMIIELFNTVYLITENLIPLLIIELC